MERFFISTEENESMFREDLHPDVPPDQHASIQISKGYIIIGMIIGMEKLRFPPFPISLGCIS